MAAQLEGLIAPNTVGMRQGTAQRAQGACALEDWGSPGCKGVAAPTGGGRVRSSTVGAGVPFPVGRDEDIELLV